MCTQGGLVPLHNACSYGHYEVDLIFNINQYKSSFNVKKTQCVVNNYKRPV